MEQIYADIMKTEKEEKGMFEWLRTLQLHSYDMYTDTPATVDQSNEGFEDKEKKTPDHQLLQTIAKDSGETMKNTDIKEASITAVCTNIGTQSASKTETKVEGTKEINCIQTDKQESARAST